MSPKPEDNGLDNEENKQFDPAVQVGSHRFEKQMFWYFFFFFLGDAWAWMPGLFLLLLPVCLFCVCFVLFFTTGKIR